MTHATLNGNGTAVREEVLRAIEDIAQKAINDSVVVGPENQMLTHALIRVRPPIGWQPEGPSSVPPMKIKWLKYRDAVKISREWNQMRINGHEQLMRSWFYPCRMCRNSRRWAVLESRVPMKWRPKTPWDLCHNTINPETYQGSVKAMMREMNAKEMAKPEIREWIVIVHLPLSDELLDMVEMKDSLNN